VLLLGEADVKALLVEVDDGGEVPGEAVVEVREGRSKIRMSSTHCNPFKSFPAVESR
jgi:hypothetical protein